MAVAVGEVEVEEVQVHGPVYETDRLILRDWQQSDREPFARLNSDPAVMEYFHALRNRRESDELIDYCSAQIAANGFGFWAVERKDTNEFIGFVGLNTFKVDLPVCPCVEIGWRLAQAQWGRGFATEAARKSLDIGFEQFALAEIYAFTALKNLRSRRVMARIGMTNTQENFLHPAVPTESELQEHCLYKITRKDWVKMYSLKV